jgi:hypothetical protein
VVTEVIIDDWTDCRKFSVYIETLKDFKITNIDSDGYTDDLQVLRGKFHQVSNQ